MENIIEGRTNYHTHISDGNFNVKVAFTEWTNSKYPAKKVTFLDDNSNTKIEFLKAIVCAPPEDDIKNKYHLVLFAKEVAQSFQSLFPQEIKDIILNKDEKIKCVLVRFFMETDNTPSDPIPDNDDLICDLYYEIRSRTNENQNITIKNNTNGLTPKVEVGNILVGN